MKAKKAYRLSGKKGYRLPEGVINVARPGKFGNPFIVGIHGDRVRCFKLCERLLAGYVCASQKNTLAQLKFYKAVKDNLPLIRKAKGFACWCPLDDRFTCHRYLFILLAKS